LGAGALAAGVPLARAEDAYPARPIVLYVPWPAGVGSDATMRGFARVAAKYLKQSVVVENVPGASGTLGPVRMSHAKPDGYTLSQIPAGIFRLPAMQKVDWDPLKDFSYIARFGGYQGAIVVRADSPFKTMADVVAYAKAHPGEVSYGSSGVGTGNHLNLAAFALKTGVNLTHIPYKGSAESLNALLGGHVMVVSSESAGSFVDGGKMRVLGIPGGKRLPRWPGIPTLKEQGYDVVTGSPFGWAGPAGMDPKIVAYLDGITRQVCEDPEFIEVMQRFDQLVEYQNTAEYKAYAQQELKDSQQLIEALGLVQK
jgi:tripartite-type tricarboxylate transporter receptor subunit TctC